MAVTFIDSGQELGRGYSVEIGDIDGDGDLDAIIGGHDLGIWLNDGSGQLAKSSQTIQQNLAGSATLADIDGDGDLDLLVTAERSNVWLNDGTGQFEDTNQLLGPQGRHFSIGDIDSDGDLDVIASCVSFNGCDFERTILWRNDGQGRFTESGQRPFGDLDLSHLYRAIRVLTLIDLNSDDRLDAVTYHYSFGQPGAEMRILFQNEDGSFADSDESAFQTGGFIGDIAVGDLDNDGDLDIFVGANSANEVLLASDDGVVRNSGQKLGYLSTRGVALGDLDGDGDLDAYSVNNFSSNRIWINDGNGVFHDAGGERNGGALSRDVALGDLDGDGDLDAIVANTGRHGESKVWLNQTVGPGDSNADGAFNQLDIVQVLQGAKYLTGERATFEQGDWNGDGLFDQNDIVAALQSGRYLQG